MGGNLENVAGYGQLSLGQAVHIAQNSDGGVDQRLAQFLERRLAEVWAKLNAQPTSYILPADEFALLNYYRPRFGDSVIVKDATKRFWDNHKADCKTLDSRTIPLTTALPVFLGGELRFRWHPGSYCCDIVGNEIGKAKSPQRSAYNGRLLQLFSICLMLITIPRVTPAVLITPPQLLVSSPASNSFTNNESSLLECLQVAPPIAISSAACQQTLMVYTFAFSYGQPFIVFRTSTAEPTQNGIVWSYVRDMSSHLALFRQPRKIIFDLGDLVDATYTGTWHTTLTATYFTAKNLLEPADIVVLVSARRSPANRPSHFTVPESRAVDALTIPQNARKAVFSISACGQAAEEFWWSNVLSSDTHMFGDDNTLYGHSPFRELQLIIDGQLAVVAWPFPVIFTGGVVPGLWRPIVDIDAFDLLEDEIDITPFFPTLIDDLDHIFEIRISRGFEKLTWTQNLAYSNYDTLANKGNGQNVRQNSSGLNTSPASTYSKAFAYPLWVASTYNAPSGGGLTIDATMKRGKNVEQIGEHAFPNGWKAVAPRDAILCGTRVTNSQNGTTSYISIPAQKKSYGSSSTEQHYLLSGIRDGSETTVQHEKVLYQRDMLAVNGSTLVNKEVYEDQQAEAIDHRVIGERVHGNNLHDFAAEGIRALLGRGPRARKVTAHGHHGKWIQHR
ncbi:hypothetical protein BU25DRAFT_425873 [Macroventuria anomochaeta]|uniref:Uncharacterized protein n=1 Tax=Macroventuria anomochaeta TaxID=301207 RepID=A0ACB6RMA0_9PLEO|nr:uncharacterized protein BU25DRAFT_425873 [Macroventuria anomochaeta]KAF2622289.1 hypothetical protein BU25DRAFT_425873 [Macroventuria anomochaeta]